MCIVENAVALERQFGVQILALPFISRVISYEDKTMFFSNVW